MKWMAEGEARQDPVTDEEMVHAREVCSMMLRYTGRAGYYVQWRYVAAIAAEFDVSCRAMIQGLGEMGARLEVKGVDAMSCEPRFGRRWQRIVLEPKTERRVRGLGRAASVMALRARVAREREEAEDGAVAAAEDMDSEVVETRA